MFKNNIYNIPSAIFKRARVEFPVGTLIKNSDYYGFSGIQCPRTGKKEICHEGKGNIGYICRYYGGFYAGDIGITICLFKEPVQLDLFNI